MADLTPAQMKAKLAEYEAKEAKRLVADNKVTMKVALKGGLSVYHGSRFPTTLYYSQWLKVLSHAPEILAYLEAHKNQLAMREDD